MAQIATANNKIKETNIFVSIPKRWRIAIICYVIIWEIIPNIISDIFISDSQHYIIPRLLLQISHELLLLLPFFLDRIGKIPIGWLHPLVFPALLSIAVSLATSPSSLLRPITIWFEISGSGFNDAFLSQLALSSWSISEASLKRDFLNLLSTILVYASFTFFSLRPPSLTIYPPHQIKSKLMIAFSICLAAFLWVIESSGGLIAHLTSFAQGRQTAIGDIGHFIVLVNFAPYLMIIWYIFDKKATTKIPFWILFLTSCCMQFLATGSRAATLLPFVYLGVAWIFYHKKIPTSRIILLAFVLFISIGLLGDIRRSGREGQVSFKAITEFNLAEAIQETQDDLESRRSRSASLAVMALVPEKVDYLWGRTYVSAIAFWIPRAIWSEKPRGVGAHVGAMIFGGRSTEKDYKGGGTPPGAVAEAYWNFSILGVVGIFFLYGSYLRWLTNMMMEYEAQPSVLGFYIISITSVTQPTTPAIVPYLQTTVLLFALYCFLGIIRIKTVSHIHSSYHKSLK